jgi:hypothetical protein
MLCLRFVEHLHKYFFPSSETNTCRDGTIRSNGTANALLAICRAFAQIFFPII